MFGIGPARRSASPNSQGLFALTALRIGWHSRSANARIEFASRLTSGATSRRGRWRLPSTSILYRGALPGRLSRPLEAHGSVAANSQDLGRFDDRTERPYPAKLTLPVRSSAQRRVKVFGRE